MRKSIYKEKATHTASHLLHGETPNLNPGLGILQLHFFMDETIGNMLTKRTSHLFALHCKEGILSHLNGIDFLYFSLLFILIMSHWTNTAQRAKYSWQTALLKSNVSRNDCLIQREFSYCIIGPSRKIFLGCELQRPKRGRVQFPYPSKASRII